jgi:hypothetical protein
MYQNIYLNYIKKELKKILKKVQYIRDLYNNHKILQFIEKNKFSNHKMKFNIDYDNKKSPPTYGDLILCLFLARLISGMGFKVKFLLDQRKLRYDWSILEVDGIRQLLSEQIELVEILTQKTEIEKEIVTNTNSKYFEFEKSAGRCKRVWGYKRFDDMEIKQDLLKIDSYRDCLEFLLYLNSVEAGNAQKDKFLLNNLSMAHKKISKPYICMNVRVGLWTERRNTDPQKLISDFMALRRSFPNFKIAILSSKQGTDFFWHIMELNKNVLNEVDPNWREFVLTQEKFDFIEACSMLLASAFYFQRNAGGLGAVAMFSQIPYLMTVDVKYDMFDVANNKIFFFSKQNQVWIDNNRKSLINDDLDKLLSRCFPSNFLT